MNIVEWMSIHNYVTTGVFNNLKIYYYQLAEFSDKGLLYTKKIYQIVIILNCIRLLVQKTHIFIR